MVLMVSLKWLHIVLCLLCHFRPVLCHECHWLVCCSWEWYCGVDALNAPRYSVVGEYFGHLATATGQNKRFCNQFPFVFVCKTLIFVVIIVSLDESKELSGKSFPIKSLCFHLGWRCGGWGIGVHSPQVECIWLWMSLLLQCMWLSSREMHRGKIHVTII